MADKLKKKLEKTFPTTEVKFGFQKGLTVRKMFIKNYKGIDDTNTGVVYKIKCDHCTQVYIGQTKLAVMERMQQHRRELKEKGKSAASDHMLNNKNHVARFDQPIILARETNWKKREIKETLITIKHQPAAYNKISHELLVFD
ncbi:unnamed protein product [Didymodactylos carnosus]|uniref:GIY-YIG domain-containing protein n=1 Tax=Didymodactylos carnosus TaxID=1234261 RepID=A0A8S2T5J0_9BILA|nr:unnamed protein product [Didymodactylos carnosus]CAF4268875.1 unnamed protein product [Didymodactylos carnosus]